MIRGLTLILSCLMSFRVGHCLHADDMVKVRGRTGPPPLPRMPMETLVIAGLTPKARSEIVTKHGKYIQQLREDGHNITFAGGRTKLFIENVKQYDNLLILTSKAKHFEDVSGVTLDDILQFIDAPSQWKGGSGGGASGSGVGNVVVVGGAPNGTGGYRTGDAIRKLAIECGVMYNPEQSAVFDHLSVDSDSDISRPVYTTTGNYLYEDTGKLFTEFSNRPVAYRGMGMKLLDKKHSNVFSLLRASMTAYVAKSPGGEPINRGLEVVLVAALQGRNNARVTFFGSIEMFEDRFLDSHPTTANFLRAASNWTFQTRGVLGWSSMVHNKIGETETPYLYTESDHIEFAVDIWQLSRMKDPETDIWRPEWVPYKAPDVQLEYTKLDPYMRTYLTPSTDRSSATYYANFTIPDDNGAFKFVILYKRPGFNTLHIESLAPIRTLRHDAFPRFMRYALPWYGSVMSSIVQTLLFSYFFLYHLPKPRIEEVTHSKTN